MSIPAIVWDKTSKKVYSIGEVSELTQVKPHMLRQWEKHFTALEPSKHLSTQNRMYNERELAIIRRIKVLRVHEHMSYIGANIRLNEELNENPEPTDLQGIRDLADKIADEARKIIHLLDTEASHASLQGEEAAGEDAYEEGDEEDEDEEEEEEEEDEPDGNTTWPPA